MGFSRPTHSTLASNPYIFESRGSTRDMEFQVGQLGTFRISCLVVEFSFGSEI